MSDRLKRISWAKADAAIRVTDAEIDRPTVLGHTGQAVRDRLHGALNEVAYLWRNGSLTNAQAFYEAKRIEKQAQA